MEGVNKNLTHLFKERVLCDSGKGGNILRDILHMDIDFPCVRLVLLCRGFHDGIKNCLLVGVKADTDDAVIYFPIGYQLPANDDDLRADINNLFYVLAAFMKEDKVIEESKFAAPRTVDFPMHAYLKVIRDYLRTGRYYIETDPRYKTDTKGRTSWSRTVREQRALVQKNGSLIFTNMTVRSNTPNADKKITQIHKYCVYEAFEKMGWLYVPYMPEKPGPHPDNREAIYILEKKLASTHNDVESCFQKN